MLPEIEALLKGTHDVPGKPFDRESLAALLRIRPYSKALDAIGAALPLPLNPYRRNNEVLQDLNLVCALSLSFRVRHGLALIIDGLGSEYDLLIAILDRLGAPEAKDYLVAGLTTCGGAIPPEGRERDEATERFDAALHALDQK